MVFLLALWLVYTLVVTIYAVRKETEVDDLNAELRDYYSCRRSLALMEEYCEELKKEIDSYQINLKDRRCEIKELRKEVDVLFLDRVNSFATCHGLKIENEELKEKLCHQVTKNKKKKCSKKKLKKNSDSNPSKLSKKQKSNRETPVIEVSLVPSLCLIHKPTLC